MAQIEAKAVLPPGASFAQLQRRNFDAVRHNRTLLWLPVCISYPVAIAEQQLQAKRMALAPRLRRSLRQCAHTRQQMRKCEAALASLNTAVSELSEARGRIASVAQQLHRLDEVGLLIYVCVCVCTSLFLQAQKHYQQLAAEARQMAATADAKRAIARHDALVQVLFLSSFFAAAWFETFF
ncbi:MAG: hypothetical protein MHM6MM_005330 [Cercozoa sp. M6MM]